MVSRLRQRQVRRRTAIHHVLNLNRRRRNVDDFIPPVYNLSFTRNEYILALLQEYFLRLSRRTRETVELQRNRWGLWRARWNVDVRLRAFRVGHARAFRLRNYFRLRHENISSVARVHRLFAA